LVRHKGYPPELQLAIQKAALMDEDMMLKWIKNVWRPFTLTKGGHMTYLLLDEWQPHMTSAVL
jgi:hypothetical protein